MRSTSKQVDQSTLENACLACLSRCDADRYSAQAGLAGSLQQSAISNQQSKIKNQLQSGS
jgi:uncharacterized Fe-S radical SAM superfamily protein PflX